MTSFYTNPDDPSARLRWAIVDALRRYGTDSTRVGHAFAALHGMQFTDLQALVAIMSAEGAADPLTPGRLRQHLNLSSAGTSYVIDRLVAGGHIERVRDHPTDNRIVHLRYTSSGQQTALTFFGPLGEKADTLMDTFTPSELTIIERFISSAAADMKNMAEALEAAAD